MYESFFNLSSRPFSAAPAVQYYFPTTVIEQSRQTLIRIVDRAEGPGVIVGQPGLGKTLLLRLLEHHFQNVFHCVNLSSAAIESRKDLLQNVLFELDLPYRNMEEGELRLSLLDFLRPSESCPHGVLLLVDEAHTLPLQLLDEIRMITNLVRDGQPRVRLVLAGDAQLDDIFADPRLDSFSQRIAARCYLEPLNQEQTIEFVRAQINTIGEEPSGIFTDDALVAVHRASGGIPRLINQVCDHALVMASLGGYHQLDAAGIEEAWADLQQLPGPWNDPAVPANEGGESIVEFGSLDENDAVNVSTQDESLDASIEGVEPLGGEFDPLDPEPAESTQDDFTIANSEDRDGAAELESEDRHTIPDPANETPVQVAASSSDSQDSLVAVDEVGPVDHDDQPSKPQDVGIGYFESNIVQIGWEADFDGPVVPADDDSNGHQTTEVEAEPTTVADTTPPNENEIEYVDPFGQGFDEEEVVIDRYADVEESVFSGCPRVSSDEGRHLASIIDQHARPQLTVVGEKSDDKEDQSDVASETTDAALDDAVIDELAAAEDEATAAAEFAEQALANHVIDTTSLSNWLFEATTEDVESSGAETNQATSIENEVPSRVVGTESSASPPAKIVIDEPLANDAPTVADSKVSDDSAPSYLQVHDGPSINDDRDMIVIDYDRNDGVFLTQSGHESANRVEYHQLFSQLRQG